MSEGEAAGVKHEPRDACMASKSSVLVLVAVLGVPDNGVSEVLHVQPNLMVTTGMRDAPQ